MRARLRRLRFGFATLLGLAEQGYFIPARHAAKRGAQDYPALRPLFQAAEPQFLEVLEAVATYGEALARLGGAAPAPRFEQDWFPRLDAAAAYALVRSRQPARILEIGSGHSTRFLARAVSDGGLATRIHCIDPAPRATIAALPVTHQAATLAEADPACLGTLGPGDMLFIDSSHVAMPGSDVDRLLLDWLPRLPSGALVHIHDILLPDAYPEAWAWRGYNEQLLVAALLLGGAFRLRFASHYVATRLRSAWQSGPVGALPLPEGALETSLWLEKRHPAP
ncbi:MAG: class I SAM-dependent methyltransferase [Rhodospirillales bacterium]